MIFITNINIISTDATDFYLDMLINYLNGASVTTDIIHRVDIMFEQDKRGYAKEFYKHIYSRFAARDNCFGFRIFCNIYSLFDLDTFSSVDYCGYYELYLLQLFGYDVGAEKLDINSHNITSRRHHIITIKPECFITRNKNNGFDLYYAKWDLCYELCASDLDISDLKNVINNGFTLYYYDIFKNRIKFDGSSDSLDKLFGKFSTRSAEGRFIDYIDNIHNLDFERLAINYTKTLVFKGALSDDIRDKIFLPSSNEFYISGNAIYSKRKKDFSLSIPDSPIYKDSVLNFHGTYFSTDRKFIVMLISVSNFNRDRTLSKTSGSYIIELGKHSMQLERKSALISIEKVSDSTIRGNNTNKILKLAKKYNFSNKRIR